MITLGFILMCGALAAVFISETSDGPSPWSYNSRHASESTPPKPAEPPERRPVPPVRNSPAFIYRVDLPRERQLINTAPHRPDAKYPWERGLFRLEPEPTRYPWE